MRPARAWFTLQDPRLEPREKNPCPECGYRLGTSPDCDTCERKRDDDEGDASDPESNLARGIRAYDPVVVVRRPKPQPAR